MVALTPARAFREFAAERFIRSLCTQNQSCRAFKELSNGLYLIQI